MSDTTVAVSGLSPTTTKESLNHFFGFCGSVSSIEQTEKSAKVTFAKASAAKTALMLDGGSLDGATLHITSEQASSGGGGGGGGGATSTSASTVEDPKSPNDGDDVNQDDKPRSAIAAELLAHGYFLGDKAITAAINLDNEHGISQRFLNQFKQIDEKFALQQKVASTQSGANRGAAQLDEKTGVTSKVASLFAFGKSYYEKALASPQGAQVRQFYSQTAKKIIDVHEEAQRLAEDKAGHPIFQLSPTNATTTSTTTPLTGTATPATGAPTEASPAPVK